MDEQEFHSDKFRLETILSGCLRDITGRAYPEVILWSVSRETMTRDIASLPDHEPKKSAAVDDRRTSAAEQAWIADSLNPALQRAPERPIGIASGTNLDANGQARFTTISGQPIDRLYTAADLPAD